MIRVVLYFVGICLVLPCLQKNTLGTTKRSAAASDTQIVNLKDFGAIGDGVVDDGPAFQKALDALAATGGGTLFVPEGKYAIETLVSKNFAGLATSIAIIGVESLTPLAPPTAPGSELSKGLDLLSEIYPRTGATQIAISIAGLRTLVIKDIAFVGTQTVTTDALATLYMRDIGKAQIKHSEFYGLASLAPGGAIVEAVRSDLEITQCKFLGSIATSGWFVPVVENIEWRGITVTDTTFLDYGQRPDFFSKSYLAAPISWINFGNAAPVDHQSPRREVVIRNVFLDEGGYWGLSSLPYRYPESAPIDLIYISGLGMNVSNFGQFGHQLYDAQRVFIEKSRYGWSHDATAAIALRNVGTGILDQLTCEAAADHIYADSDTRELTIINSTYAQLDSFAQTTNTINTANDEDDPVQYVRARFNAALGREPDPAAHFYWSDLLIRCFEDSSCQNDTKQALNDYLSASPAPTFTISGRSTHADGTPVAGLTVTLSGSQSVTTTTDQNGDYFFSNLPTSGRYLITPSQGEYMFDSPVATFITPNGNRTANFTVLPATHLIKGSVKVSGKPLAGVAVVLSGSASGTATTNSEGEYSFTVKSSADYVLTPIKTHYTFDPGTRSVSNLRANTIIDFSGTLVQHSISGHVRTTSGEPLSGVLMTLSGSVNRTTTTSTDGSYSFTDIDDGASCTVTASRVEYLMTPTVQIFNDLAVDGVADFLAARLPALLTVTDTDKAIALEFTTLIADPFPLSTAFSLDGDNSTRIIVFGTNLGLLPGEDAEALMVEAEDPARVRHSLKVESVTALPELPGITQIVLRLNDNLPAGDVFLSVTVRGLTSNKARIGIGTAQ